MKLMMMKMMLIHADYDEVGHEKGKRGTFDLNGAKNPSWFLLLFDFRFRLKIGGGTCTTVLRITLILVRAFWEEIFFLVYLFFLKIF